MLRGPIDRWSLWSKADIALGPNHVRFTPKSRHVQRTSACPLCANSGHRLFDHLVDADRAGYRVARTSRRRSCSRTSQ
jgi:hypothetical protein